MGMNDDTELCLMTKAMMQAALDFLRGLAGEWEWKRNSIPKNGGEMADLDLLIWRLEQRLSPSNVGCCGGCEHFDGEDISGAGWCTAADHATACGDRCLDYHDNLFKPNQRVGERPTL